MDRTAISNKIKKHAKGVHRQSKSRLSAKKNQTGKHTAASLACFLLYGNATVPAYAAILILENQPFLSQSARLPAWLSGKPGIPIGVFLPIKILF